jgi:hypothetical protein
MLSKADYLRRKIGVLFLAIAVILLIAGFTVLEGKLDPRSQLAPDRGKDRDVAYLIYWAVCFGFTFLSAAVALLDVMIIRAKTREEHKKELRNAFEEKPREGDA